MRMSQLTITFREKAEEEVSEHLSSLASLNSELRELEDQQTPTQRAMIESGNW